MPTDFPDKVPENHSLAEWEKVEDDAWTTRFRADSQYQIEVYYQGGESGNAWEISLLESANNGILNSVDSQKATGAEEALQYAEEYANNPADFK